MINQQLLDYIKQSLAQGSGKDFIKSSLIASGWQAADIDEVFGSLVDASRQSPIKKVKKDKVKNWKYGLGVGVTIGVALVVVDLFTMGLLSILLNAVLLPIFYPINYFYHIFTNEWIFWGSILLSGLPQSGGSMYGDSGPMYFYETILYFFSSILFSVLIVRKGLKKGFVYGYLIILLIASISALVSGVKMIKQANDNSDSKVSFLQDLDRNIEVIAKSPLDTKREVDGRAIYFYARQHNNFDRYSSLNLSFRRYNSPIIPAINPVYDNGGSVTIGASGVNKIVIGLSPAEEPFVKVSKFYILGRTNPGPTRLELNYSGKYEIELELPIPTDFDERGKILVRNIGISPAGLPKIQVSFLPVVARQSAVSIKSTSYDLMSEILAALNIKNVSLVKTSLEWNTGKYETPNGKMTKEVFNGYGFEVTRSAVENETLKAMGKTDDLNIGSRFGGALSNRGFVFDGVNSGDATFHATLGYAKGDFICVIKTRITTPPEQVGDHTPVATVDTVACADKNDK
ncbi:MAG: hypothetical protein Q7R85_03330 [bacterium]|nr:hypothetical protein [bacterium]